MNKVMLFFLYSSGLISDDWGELTMEKVIPQFRLDSILIRGINNMSTEEIFSYLYEMGLTPQAMEWVNDACCKFF
jgi:nuclear cap-binding protein subunit 3